MSAILGLLMQNAIIAAVMIPLVALACRVFRQSPAVQHALWLLVLLKLVTPPLVAWPWSTAQLSSSLGAAALSSGLLPGWVLPADPSLSSFAVNSGRDLSAGDSRNATGTAESSKHAITAGLGEISASHADGQAQESLIESCNAWLLGLAPWLIGLWFGGAIVCLVRQLKQMLRQARLIRHGQPATSLLIDEVGAAATRLRIRVPQIVMVTGMISPFLWCLGKIRLVWPESLAAKESISRSRVIIGHELAHLCRRDHWVAWLEMGASVIWWWNPLFWLVRNRLRETAEMACDALALSAHPDSRREYAEALLELSAGFPAATPAMVLGVRAATAASFERRFAMILSQNVSGKLSRLGLIVLIAAAFLALPHWSSGPQGATPAETEDERASGPEPKAVAPACLGQIKPQTCPAVTASGLCADGMQQVLSVHQKGGVQHGLELCKKCHESQPRVLHPWPHGVQAQSADTKKQAADAKKQAADAKKQAASQREALCSACHQTPSANTAKNAHPTTDLLFKHLGCQSCHGASSESLRLAPNQEDWHRLLNPGMSKAPESQKDTKARQSHQEAFCQTCHGSGNERATSIGARKGK